MVTRASLRIWQRLAEGDEGQLERQAYKLSADLGVEPSDVQLAVPLIAEVGPDSEPALEWRLEVKDESRTDSDRNVLTEIGDIVRAHKASLLDVLPQTEVSGLVTFYERDPRATCHYMYMQPETLDALAEVGLGVLAGFSIRTLSSVPKRVDIAESDLRRGWNLAYR